MEDAQDLAEKYKAELEIVKDKYEKINEYIHDARTNTIKHDAEHAKFVNDTTTNYEDIEAARFSQTKMNYSLLESDITELKEHMDNQKIFV